MQEDIIISRLKNQHLIGDKFKTPEEVVRWFGAVQAQDLLGSMWGIGLRVEAATQDSIEKAVADKKIVRTWPMRGTIHFVSPETVRCMLKILTPKVVRGMASRFRQLELDEDTFVKSRKIVSKALVGNKQLMRRELLQELEAGKVSTSGQRGIHIFGKLAMEGLICIGPRKGKQQTFVLLDEWVPNVREIATDEALANLATSYFQSHGPATVYDFSWWSGLTITESKKAIESVRENFETEVVNGKQYWFKSFGKTDNSSNNVSLLPTYDEYSVAYKDRSILLDSEHHTKLRNGIFSPIIVLNGKVVGNWKRTLKKNSVEITTNLVTKLSTEEARQLELAAKDYSHYLGLNFHSIR